MSVSVLDMSVSLDGYIADQDDYLGGEDGERLHKWAEARDELGQPAEAVAQFNKEWSDGAGAVVAGRRTAELMDHWGGTTADSRSSSPVTARPRRPRAGAIPW